jgi:hypothetical protein
MTTSNCKGCGKPILWAQSPTVAMIPLSKVANAYEVFNGKAVKIDTLNGIYISHFLVCPNANQFSKRKDPKNENQTEQNQSPG